MKSCDALTKICLLAQACRDCSLSHRSVAAHVESQSHDYFQNMKTMNSRIHMKQRAGCLSVAVFNSWENRHITRMALMNHAVKSWTLSREMGSFKRLEMSAQTNGWCFQQHRLSFPWPCFSCITARMPSIICSVMKLYAGLREAMI